MFPDAFRHFQTLPDIPRCSQRASQTTKQPNKHASNLLGLFWSRSGVVLGLFWGCSGVVLGFFWGCSGVVLGLFWGCSGAVLGLRRSFNIQRSRQGYPGQLRELDPMKATTTPRKQPNKAKPDRAQKCQVYVARVRARMRVRVRARPRVGPTIPR